MFSSLAPTMTEEFNRQVQVLLDKGYPALIGTSDEELRKNLEPLRSVAVRIAADIWPRPIPFVIVIKHAAAAAEKTIKLVEREGKTGVTMLDDRDFAGFQPLPSVKLPLGIAYLLVDVDTGSRTLNVTPNEAFELFERQNRLPLTLEEGIAVLTHFPEAIKKNHGFSLLASRAGDKRVTAVWISQGAPKLGWCWAGNPHTWLGSASATQRLGA